MFQLNNLHYDDAGAVGHHADGDWDDLGSPVQETSWGVDWRRDTSSEFKFVNMLCFSLPFLVKVLFN